MARHARNRVPHEGVRDSRQRSQFRNADLPPRARAPMSSSAPRHEETTMQTQRKSPAIPVMEARQPAGLSLERGRAGSPLGRGGAQRHSGRARLRPMTTPIHLPNDSWFETPASAPLVGATAQTAEHATAPEALASAARRERLLAASAAASRLLLQAPDVMAVVPKVLQLVGEAAAVDRVLLLLKPADSAGCDQLVLASEWSAQAGRAAVAGRTQIPKTVSVET